MAAARSAFSELGYDATTFQNIASRASLTRPAVNHYFVNKEALYRAVLDEAEAFIGRAVDRARMETDLIGQLSSFMSFAAQLDEQDRTVAAFIVTSVLDTQRHPELRQVVGDLSTTTRRFLAEALTDAVDRGELTTARDIPALADMLSATLWGIGYYVSFVGDRVESAAVIADVTALLANRVWQLRQPEQPGSDQDSE